MSIQKVISESRVPVKIWASDLEPEAEQQERLDGLVREAVKDLSNLVADHILKVMRDIK